MKTVELHNAWTWDCEECGHLNFSRSITLEADEAELADLERHNAVVGGDFPMGVEWLTRPNVVVCSACQTKFQARCEDEEE